MLKQNIFREYDIRGIVDQELNADTLYALGQAVGTLGRRRLSLNAPTVTVARDARLTSPAYQSALMAGLLETGCQVVDCGMMPTPVLTFAHLHTRSDLGLMVTASHNPREYNGLKLRLRGIPLIGGDITELYHLIQQQDFLQGTGHLSSLEIADAYLDAVCARVRLDRPLKLVLDSGNGAAGPIAAQLYRRLGCEVIELYTEPDGRFPNHLADPTVARYMIDLANRVRAERAEVGIGLDGDGDRMGAVDEKGEHWQGDRLLMLFARQVLARHPGAPIVFDIKCSQELVDDIERHGGQAIMWKTGYPLIGQKLLESQALLAGEMSGHIYFADNYFAFDDGLYAGARLLEILASSPEPLSTLLPPSRLVSTPELRLRCSDALKFEVVDRLEKQISPSHDVTKIDGVRIQFKDGWGLIRASNTQPALVARFEAASTGGLEKNMRTVQSVLDHMGFASLDLFEAMSAGGGDH